MIGNYQVSTMYEWNLMNWLAWMLQQGSVVVTPTEVAKAMGKKVTPSLRKRLKVLAEDGAFTPIVNTRGGKLVTIGYLFKEEWWMDTVGEGGEGVAVR